MNIAKEYLTQQMKNQAFQRGFLSEKARLDLEYQISECQLEEMKRDIDNGGRHHVKKP